LEIKEKSWGRDSPTFTAKNVILTSIAGNPVNFTLGDAGDYHLDVHVADTHHKMWNHYFSFEPGITDTTNGITAIDSKTIILNDATGFNAGDKISLHIGTVHTHSYREIISIATNTLTIDAGVDTALPDGSQIDQKTFNMAVDGSTPQVFAMHPSGTEIIHITRMLIEIVHSAAGDDSKFGGIAALTNGIHVRKNVNNGESYETLAIWKANKDLKEDMYDVTYGAKAGGGANSTTGRWSLRTGSGAIISLDASNNEFIECVIQDDLTDLTDFQIKMQGHFEIT